MTLEVTRAGTDDLVELADVAARTFPLACPPTATAVDVAAFIAGNLTAEHFRAYLDDANRVVLAAREDARMLGYAILIRGVPHDDDVQHAVTRRPAVELSKMYVLPNHHGSGVSAALMTVALDTARTLHGACAWLGVNKENQRAQRFYAKHGFAVTGTKTFRLGAHLENDYVMVRPL